MKQKIKTILDKYPRIFIIVKTVRQSINHAFLAIKKIFSSKYDLRLYTIYNQFLALSGLDGSKATVDIIEESSLNTNSYDLEIEKTILEYYKVNKDKFVQRQIIQKESQNKNIGILFTEIYAVGGHTPLIERLVESFSSTYNMKAFATLTTNHSHPKLEKKINIERFHWIFGEISLIKFVLRLYNSILQKQIDVLFTYLHPHDIVAVAVLALLKEHSNVKVCFVNMQDHFYNLGYKFAHIIVDARPAGLHITKNIRGYKNTILMPLQQKHKAETFYYSDEEKMQLRKHLGIEEGEYFTLTGCASFKIFDKSGSKYFEMIKVLLEKEPLIKHIVMMEFDRREYKDIIKGIFQDSPQLFARLKIIDRVSEYDIYMQTCDLLIDSFPQGGALIHLDMMRNKKATVVKVNKDNPFQSFEFYLPPNYEYMYENTEDMIRGICKLLHSPEEQSKASGELYNYYLDNYEFNVVKEKYEKLIVNSENLETLYEAHKIDIHNHYY